MFKKMVGGSLAAGALAIALVAPVSAANEAGDSLVNVQISDVTVALPISIAANVCDVNINVLAEQLDAGDATCTATAESIATPGTDGRGGNQAGDSLVNVQVDDLTVLLPIGIAANVCDVSVAVLAQLALDDAAPCTASADPDAEITRVGGSGGGPRQEGLVNVNASDITVQIPIGVAANVCDVSVAVLTGLAVDDAAPCNADADPNTVDDTITLLG